MPGRGKFFEDMVGSLLRHIEKAGGHTAREAADEATHAARESMFRRARAARDDLVEDIGKMSNRKAKKYYVITGAVDPETGIASAERSGWWGCAEDGALRNINEERARRGLPALGRNDVYYSEALNRNKAGEYVDEMPICGRNCQGVSDPDRYPDNVRFDRNGPWDARNSWSE